MGSTRWTRNAQLAEAPIQEAPSPAPADPEPEAPVLRPVAQPGVQRPAVADRFPVRSVTAGAHLWWVGAHGGAGESTLEQLIDGSRAAGHAWPVNPLDAGPDAELPRVALVARTHAAGLEAAKRLLTEWASGTVHVELLGLVLVADAPGKLPRVLKDFSDLVAGGAPLVWHLPWVDAWRTGEPVDPTGSPRPVRRCTEDLNHLVSRSSTPTQRS